MQNLSLWTVMLLLCTTLQQCTDENPLRNEDSSVTGLLTAPPEATGKLQALAPLAMTVTTNPGWSLFLLNLGGDAGTVTVDWGDGNQEVYTLPNTLIHEYATSGTYPVTITGDLDVIQTLSDMDSADDITTIDLKGLPNLRELQLGLVNYLATVDLRYNPAIRRVTLFEMSSLQQVLLADDNAVDFLEIVSGNNMNTGTIDNTINALYHSVVAQSRSGYINLYKGMSPWHTTVYTGPPSEAAIAKLRELRDTYGWNVQPANIFDPAPPF